MSTRRISLATVISAVIVGVTLPDGGVLRAASSEISQEQAISRALQYSGLGVQPEVTVSAEATTVPADDDVPFLRLAGKPAWRITLDNVRIVTRGPDGKAYENPYIHSLDVWLDRADGRLFKIISPPPPDVDASLKATLALREASVKSGPKRYVGLPAEMPRVNFIQMLQSRPGGTGGPTEYKQVEALYVLLRQVDVEESPSFPCRDKPCPRWITSTRYLPPTPFFGLPPGVRQEDLAPRPFTHFRTEIDPETGKILGSSESYGTVNGRPAPIP